MIIEDRFEQRSEEWYRAKAGVPGASSFDNIITPSGSPSKSAEGYAYQLAGEKMIGRIEETFTSFAMQEGIRKEGEARTYYELINGCEVRQVALVYKDEGRSVACSPDGLMSDTGLEIKCPLLKTHVGYMLGPASLVKKYHVQVQGSMWVCGFDSWQLISYYPGLEPVIITVRRDGKFIAKLETEMIAFIRRLNEVYAELIRKAA